MKIYFIEHCDSNVEYDSYLSHVVVAKSEEQCRSLVKKISQSEGSNIWDSAKIEILGPYDGIKKDPFIANSNFLNG